MFFRSCVFLRSSSFALSIMFDDAQCKQFYLPTVIGTFPGLSKVCFSFFELQISLLNFTTLCLLHFVRVCNRFSSFQLDKPDF